ncbi:MAG: efflux RND transporter permease subunit, partial [Verrucomicrobia bacterium]|nr:efflux RND transporter permease subunit [Verrucomicrobiota bacterium]
LLRHSLQRPLATVVIGGVMTSTVLTLLVLPVLYQWLAGRTGDESASGASCKSVALLQRSADLPKTNGDTTDGTN